MKTILYLLMIALIASCQPREFSIIRNFDPTGKKKITLDNTYQFFVREIYKESTHHISKDSTAHNYSLSDRKMNTDSSKKELLEIEYLLYSIHHRKLVYITTVPDRYQKYYAAHARPETQMNARDFITFHFGKIRAPDKADFKTYRKHISYTWQYDIRADSFMLRRIIETKNGIYQNERSVENSIYEGAKFRRVNHFEFIFKNDKCDDSTIVKMSDPTFYVTNKGKKYSVYLHFDDVIPKRKCKKRCQNKKRENSDSTMFTTIIFKGKSQIPYNPDGVVE